jgi:hypothetical protein
MTIRRDTFSTAYIKFDQLLQKMTYGHLTSREYAQYFAAERRMTRALQR